MMQAGYVNTFRYYAALGVTFAAKKSAEIAPGVGKATDIHLIRTDQMPDDISQ